MTPADLLNRLLYRDPLMLVIDKPAGVLVHPGPSGGENLEQHFDILRFGLPGLPALAHRLDRDTSGCLILGRHRKALRKLGILFQNGKINKTYWAIVEGVPPAASGIIDRPLKKQTEQKNRWYMMIDDEGQEAITGYKLLGTYQGLSWLELYPKTGRTHQIRVHCASIGCPLLGDSSYNLSCQPGQTLALHARSVEIPLYPSRPPVVVMAEPPLHIQQWIDRMVLSEGDAL